MKPTDHESIIRDILIARKLDTADARAAFLESQYGTHKHDPFMLPDMTQAVERLVRAHRDDEQVVIYGDYDIDGLTATTVLLDAFESFGIRARAFIPNRFVEGYGLSLAAIELLADQGARLIVTVDCGSLSHSEIARAGELGVDVIVTDHHSVAETMPPAVAVVNPKRLLEQYPEQYQHFELVAGGGGYPFVDLAGVGVAFKLVQALQTVLDGLPDGQEKWLLDLVALGTVCDVVTLRNENRANVRWGLEVMRQTRRPGIRALMAVSRVKPGDLSARSLGFGLGPRLNAAGRLETAQISLDLLTSRDPEEALELAQQLDAMNTDRRSLQDAIYREARIKAAAMTSDPVLIVSDPAWSHGIIGIVAAKLLEKYRKPVFVLQELDDGTAKGSARSFGDYSAVEGIRATEQHLIKGGGHQLAAGVTLSTSNIDAWREAITAHYRGLELGDQRHYLLPRADVSLDDFAALGESLITAIKRLEPYGNGNPEPIFSIASVSVAGRRVMGVSGQHVKYTFADRMGRQFQMIAFSKADEFTAQVGDRVTVWCELTLNEWQGRKAVEGRLLRIEDADLT